MTGEARTTLRSIWAPAVAALSALALLLVATGGAGAAPLARSSIVSGGPANFKRWEFAAALFFRNRFICTAEVLAPDKVLTAAHCVVGRRVARLTVVTGRPRLRQIRTGESSAVTAKAVHPDYHRQRRHDFALLTLETPTSAPAVALPTREQNREATATGKRLRVAGYGTTNPAGTRLPGFLKATNQRVRANGSCKRAYGNGFSAWSMICALGKPAPRFTRRYRRLLTRRYGRRVGRRLGRINASPCHGDSGGPLVADTADGTLLVGVTSFGSGICGLRITPSVYARVADALTFINQNITPP